MIWYIFVLVNYDQPTPTRDPASQQRHLAGSVLLLGFWDLLLARIVRCGRFTRKSGNSMDFPMKIGLIGEYNRIYHIFSQTHLVPAKDRWCSSLFRDIEQALPELVLWRVQVALTAPSSKESKGQTDRTCFQTDKLRNLWSTSTVWKNVRIDYVMPARLIGCTSHCQPSLIINHGQQSSSIWVRFQWENYEEPWGI